MESANRQLAAQKPPSVWFTDTNNAIVEDKLDEGNEDALLGIRVQNIEGGDGLPRDQENDAPAKKEKKGKKQKKKN